MKVIIVAYNQFELLQMEIEALRLLAGIEERDSRQWVRGWAAPVVGRETRNELSHL